jgi:hypothetical protein
MIIAMKPDHAEEFIATGIPKLLRWKAHGDDDDLGEHMGVL